MASVNMRQLLEAGVHFGHQTRRWNPKMKPYIFTARNGIYIVDLRQTATAFREALHFLHEVAANGGSVLFVGTKRQAQEAVREAAERTGMFFVNQRWLGGLLTNFETIRRSVARLKDLEAMDEDGRMALLPKKEAISLRREKGKLFRNLEGIKEMTRLPDAVFVIDVKREQIAVREAMKLNVPIVAIVDTNCDPDGIDFVVPGNDDALRAIRLFVSAAAETIADGAQLHAKAVEVEAGDQAEAGDAAEDTAEPTEGDETDADAEQEVETAAGDAVEEAAEAPGEDDSEAEAAEESPDEAEGEKE